MGANLELFTEASHGGLNWSVFFGFHEKSLEFRPLNFSEFPIADNFVLIFSRF